MSSLKYPLLQKQIPINPDKEKHSVLTIKVIKADITQLEVGAIVNAANSTLLGGGGVDGAIHRAAGPELVNFCRTLNGCATGEAKLSPGFKLPAPYVIHTVGPVWQGGNRGEAQLLANCYHNCLQLAQQNHIRSIAFPAISTGVYGYPITSATEIAINTVIDTLTRSPLSCNVVQEVVFCCFSDADAAIYQQKLAAL